MASAGSPTLFCCLGVAGCQFQPWNGEQRLEHIEFICNTHGKAIVDREAVVEGITEPDYRDALEAAKIQVLPDRLSVGGPAYDVHGLGEQAPTQKRPRGAPETLSAAWQKAAADAPNVKLPLCLAPADIKTKLAASGMEEKINVALPPPAAPIIDGCFRNMITARLGEWSRDVISYAVPNREKEVITQSGYLKFNNAGGEEAAAKMLAWAELAQARALRLSAQLPASTTPEIDFAAAPLSDEAAAAVVAEADCGDLMLSKHSTFSLYFPKSTEIAQVQHARTRRARPLVA